MMTWRLPFSITATIEYASNIARPERSRTSHTSGQQALCSDCAKAFAFWIDTSRGLLNDTHRHLPIGFLTQESPL